jgi:hypothetical protein
MWKKAVVAYFTVLLRSFAGGAEGRHVNPMYNLSPDLEPIGLLGDLYSPKHPVMMFGYTG